MEFENYKEKVLRALESGSVNKFVQLTGFEKNEAAKLVSAYIIKNDLLKEAAKAQNDTQILEQDIERMENELFEYIQNNQMKR